MTRSTHIRLGLALSLLALPGCATLTPQRCEEAAQGLQTVAAIAQVLIDRGVEPVKAGKLAEAVHAGQVALSLACAEAAH